MTLGERRVRAELYQLLLRPNIKKAILDEVRRRAHDEGETFGGLKIGSYANSTIKRKKRKGHIWEHMTLKDTGRFYKSIRFKPQPIHKYYFFELNSAVPYFKYIFRYADIDKGDFMNGRVDDQAALIEPIVLPSLERRVHKLYKTKYDKLVKKLLK